MIYQLPTRSPRRYRGKYPARINSWSCSRSPSQRALADFLHLSRPVHLELNDGQRFIADMCDLVGDLRLAMDMNDAVLPRTTVVQLGQDRYDAMLALVREARA